MGALNSLLQHFQHLAMKFFAGGGQDRFAAGRGEFSAREIGNGSTGLTDHQATGGRIPVAQIFLPEPIEPPGGHAGQIVGRAAITTNRETARQKLLEPSQVAPCNTGLTDIIGETGYQKRPVQGFVTI